MLFDRLLTNPLPYEHVTFYLRRHWFTFAREAAFYVFLLALPVAGSFGISTYLPNLWERLFNGELTEVIVMFSLSLFYLGVWAFFWNAWVDYYLDVWLVTSERVLALEQRGLFNRTVSELRLGRVQDISSHVAGLYGTFLHFGQVKIQTAGEEPYFIFHDVPKPYEVAERILRLADDWRQTHTAQPEVDP